MFTIDLNKNSTSGNLAYNEATYEFISTPLLNSDITLLVGYINIGFDSETNEATQIWGFHHNFNWKETKLDLPKRINGSLKLDNTIEPGDSIRIKEANSWNTYFDRDSGWIKFGSDEKKLNTIFIEFFSNTALELDENNNLIGLWLKPTVSK